jgi:hypothetical protein
LAIPNPQRPSVATISSSNRPKRVLFLTLRGFRHTFSGFLHVPRGADPAKFFEAAAFRHPSI